MIYFAHTDHKVEATQSGGLLDALTHQPVWVSLLIIAFVLFGVYVLLEKLKVKPFNRILALLPLLILIALLYLEHNPAVTTIILSIGFVTAFFIAFTMMTTHRDSDESTPKTNKSKKHGDQA